jgi:DNA-directed RNA polymerase-3 subunit RPC5
LHPISKYIQLRTSLQYLDEKSKSGARSDDEEKSARVANASIAHKLAKVSLQHYFRRPLRLVADGQWEEENDGSGSIKDFRNKMWSMANREKEDFWVPYAWNEGEVGFFI